MGLRFRKAPRGFTMVPMFRAAWASAVPLVSSIAIGALTLGLTLGACDDEETTPGANKAGAGGSGAGGGAGGGVSGAGGAGSGGAAGVGGAAGAGGGGVAGQAGAPSDEQKWGCLDEPAPTPSADPFDVTWQIVTNAALAPAVGATARACGRLDVACDEPLAPAAAVDAEGKVTLQVPGTFNGYFEIRNESPDPAKAFVPLNVFVPTSELVRGGAEPRRLIVFRGSEVLALASFVGGSFSPDTPPNAFLLATALDCLGSAAGGVSFSLTPESLRSPQTGSFYTGEDSLPSMTATETVARGLFAMTNLNAGAPTLAGTLNEGRRPLALTSALTRDGQMTQIFVGPHP